MYYPFLYLVVTKTYFLVEPRLLSEVGGVILINNTQDTTRTRTLNCSADGIPAPAIRWTRDGVLLVNTPPKYTITDTEEAGNIRISEISEVVQTRGELTITNVGESDNGLYVCRADNGAGRADVLGTPYRINVTTRKCV